MIYETRCLVNGKTYVGKHQTRNVNDGYVGSGKLLRRAIKKHGAGNFVTRVLYDFDVEWKMNVAEKILVCTDPEVSYNLCPGGQGGWGYVNANGLNFDLNNKLSPMKLYVARSKGGKATISSGKRGFAALTPERRSEISKSSSGTLGKRFKQRNHNPASHPRGPRGPYKRSKKSCQN